MKEGHQQAIEEKHAAIAWLNDELQKREYENVGLKHEKMCIRLSLKNVKTALPILKHAMFLMQEI